MNWKTKVVRWNTRNIHSLIAQGEGANLEFKETLEADATTGARSHSVLHAILKTVAAFHNTDGGTLLIGVSDKGQIRGLELDFALLGKRGTTDGFELKLRDLLRAHLKPPPLGTVAVSFETLGEGAVCRVDVTRSSQVVQVDEKEVYVRDGNATRKLEGRELINWLSQRNAHRRLKAVPIAAIGTLLLVLVVYYLAPKQASALPTRPIRAGFDEPLNPCALPAAPPEDSEAKRLYMEGCRKISTLDYPSARALFEEALNIEPQNVPARVALADAWSWLGYDERATQEATKALQLSGKLSPEMTLWVKGKYYGIVNEFDKATATYQALWKLSPDNLDYGLQLARVQLDAADGQSALATLNELPKLSATAGDDPRIDLLEAEAAELLGDFARQRSAAQNALKKSTSKQGGLLAAEAKRWLGMAYRSLGDQKAARASLREAKDAFGSLGDQLGAALAQHEIAEMLEDEGDLEQAFVIYSELVHFYGEIGNKTNLASALSSVAGVLTANGDLGGAIRAYDDMLAAARNVRDRSDSATALTRKGDLLLWEGDLADAKKLYEQSLLLSRDLKDKSVEADTLDSLASALVKQGELAGAAKACLQIRAINEGLGRKRTQTGSWRSFVEVSLETGNYAGAEAAARQSAQQFAQEKSPISEASANNLLARSLLVQGKLTQAQAAITRPASILEKNKDLHLRLEVAITAARVRAALGRSSDAENDMEVVLADAKRVGFFDLQLEASLVLGELQLRNRQGGSGRARLAALEAEARSRGFGLIARKAATARRRR